MKALRTTWNYLLIVAALACAGFLLAGCETTGTTPATTAGAGANALPPAPNVLQIGDLVKVEFSGLPPQATMLPHEEHIKEDGTITLSLIGSIQAAGKTIGQLQKDIRDAYVPRFYKHLSVVVKGADLFYYVGGQVKAPGRQLYLGPITVTGAIKSAGDFTDFANRKRVQLIRANGATQTVNCIRLKDSPEDDPPVYPGDRIDVPQSIW